MPFWPSKKEVWTEDSVSSCLNPLPRQYYLLSISAQYRIPRRGKKRLGAPSSPELGCSVFWSTVSTEYSVLRVSFDCFGAPALDETNPFVLVTDIITMYSILSSIH